MHLRTTLSLCCATILLLHSVAAADHHGGFKSLFNGQDLSDWDGDPRFWRVENGEIVGETTEDNKAERNTFLIYRGSEFGNFELEFSYQVKGYNSGIQYRSVDNGDWKVTGYQADFEDRHHGDEDVDKYSGMFFDEIYRLFLAQRGQVVVVTENTEKPREPHRRIIASVGDRAELEKVINRDGWNKYRIIVNGYQFTHIINDRVMAIGFDEDAKHRRASGVLAFQLHSGPPMQIRMKDIRIRALGH